MTTVKHHKEPIANEDRKVHNNIWKEKVATTFASGSAWAHRINKIFSGSAFEEVTAKGPYSIVDVLEEQRTNWKGQWAGTGAPIKPEVLVGPQEVYEVPAKPSTGQVRKLSGKYKIQTIQVGGLHPRPLHGLSDQALDTLIQFWHWGLIVGQLPQSQRHVGCS
jgi:hypothetical protein